LDGAPIIYSQGMAAGETFHDVLARRAAAHPDREALVDHRHRVTYGELLARVERTAAGLQRLGIGPGDVVTIQLPNWVEFAYVFFACERLGAIANQIGPDFRSREVEYIVRFSESRAFVCPATFKGFDYVDMMRALRPTLTGLKAVLTLGGGDRDTVSLDDLIYGPPPPPPLQPYRLAADAVMRMAFTSGTTGNPKGVTHSFDTTLPAAEILNDAMRATERDVFLIYLPLGLNWGYLTLLQSIMVGARAVLLDRFSGRAALDLIERERVTFIPSAPAAIIAMLNDPELGRFDLRSLRVVITGGASCPVETIRAFRARMPGHLIELYGMLETGFHTFTRFDDDPEAVAGTIGRPAPRMALRIIDEQAQDVPPGAQGEIAARGPSVHLGYYKNPAANTELFTADGWFRTGDLGVMEPSGNVRIVGRLKEMINRGGKKFFPREVEEILYTHPSVLHAAIVGVPDPRLGERNCLCVIPRPGKSVSLPEMVAYLRDGVAAYKLPEELEVFEEFPFTPTGKIQRHALTRQVLARRST
jgi:non-ribosomal peptide synthetase component E (peptide arylation enzyme)